MSTAQGSSHTPIGRSDCSEPVARLIDLIRRETAALKANDWSELADFNRRKNQGLLELRRILQSAKQPEGAVEHDRLLELRDALKDNAAILQRHLDAARHVSQMISDAAVAAQSDGTYSSSIAHRKDT
jgi:hypothetical protein